MPTPASLHIIGSNGMGGAERWLLRFTQALQRTGAPVTALVRSNSTLAHTNIPNVPTHTSPLYTVWDPLSRWHLNHSIRRIEAPIVQTYMGRATRLTHLPIGKGRVHIARLGGYYDMAPFRHAHAWVGNTQGLCNWMIQQGLPSNRVFHIYNFADPALPQDPTQQAALRTTWGITPEDFVLLTAGRFVRVKGHNTLLDAFARLPRQHQGRTLKLALLGEGDLQPQLEAQARQLGIFDRIIWAGWQAEPAQWFHLCDMVVFPSRDAETLGNVILEAWAYGKPLVATQFRGARELAQHGVNAYLTPLDDAPALAQGIQALLDDATLAQNLTEAGMQRVTQDFGEATIVAQYQTLYEDLLRTATL